jgi:hypothetical protein
VLLLLSQGKVYVPQLVIARPWYNLYNFLFLTFSRFSLKYHKFYHFSKHVFLSHWHIKLYIFKMAWRQSTLWNDWLDLVNKHVQHLTLLLFLWWEPLTYTVLAFPKNTIFCGLLESPCCANRSLKFTSPVSVILYPLISISPVALASGKHHSTLYLYAIIMPRVQAIFVFLGWLISLNMV